MHDSERIGRLLSERFRGRVATDLAERVACARDLWLRHLIAVQQGPAVDPAHLPAAVVSPETTEDVVRLVELARREGLPLVPFGAGSGVCGGIECEPRSVVVDTKRLRGPERVDPGPALAIGPGVFGVTLEETLERKGFTIGHFPSSILCSTVGGWVATRGAGQCSGRYGKIEDMLVGAECVLGTGEVLRLRRRANGFDLSPLFVGSEGAFGIFTELELRMHPLPETRAFAAFELPDMRCGTAALRRVYQSGLRPPVARLYDPLDSLLLSSTAKTLKEPRLRPDGFGLVRSAAVRALLRAPRLIELALGAAEESVLSESKLLFVFEGTRDEVRSDLERATTLVEREGGRALGEGLARAWYERRYAVSYRQSPVFRAGIWNDTMEVAAPWSKLDRVYREVRSALGQHVLVMAHMSHAYPDGCSVYFTFVGRSRGAESVKDHERIWRDALDAVLEAGGVASHHHGVGRLRKEALHRELGPGAGVAYGAMKRAWDPHGIMNPGSPFEPGDTAPRSGSTDNAPWQLDPVSGLVRIRRGVRLDEVERALRREGSTLGIDPLPASDVDAWIAAGMPGLPDPFLDPVDQRIAGLEATLSGGAHLDLRPSPRRATGPDLGALFTGTNGRLGRVEAAWLRIRPASGASARPLPFARERDPVPAAGEAHELERLVASLGGGSKG